MIDLVVLDSAAEDLELGRDFYDECELGIGNYFVDCLTADLSSLRIYPGVHNIFEGFFKLNSKRFPFAIYYDYDGELVTVAAVLDMRQNPDFIRDSLQTRKNRGRA